MSCIYQADTDSAAWRTIDGEVIIMRLQDGIVFTLQEVSAFIWGLLEKEPRSARAVVDAVCQEFEVDAQAARADVAELLADLTAEQLIRQADQGPAEHELATNF